MTLPSTSGTTVDLDRLLALSRLADRNPAHGWARSHAGVRSGPRRGEGGELFDLRPFQDGDDPRHVDPAASARSGRLQVRSRHEQVDATTLLVADFRRSMFWGTRTRFRSVAAAEALALEGWRIVAAGGRVGALVLRNGATDSLAPRPRDAAMVLIAEMLARSHADAVGDTQAAPALAACIDRIGQKAQAGTSVLIATGLDTPSDDFDAALAALIRKCRVTILLVQDAVEVAPPAGVHPVKCNGEVLRGRFSASPSTAYLHDLGVETRLIRADRPPEAA
jgi:uncharacterized protein (DUF58 family)